MVSDSSHLRQAIDALQRPTVAVVGDFMLDRYLWGKVDRISPEAPIPVLAVTRQDVRIGNAGAVLSNLATFGAECIAVGLLGDDEPGRTFRGILAELGISDELVLTDRRRATSLKTRLIARTQQLLRVDEEEISPLAADVQEKLAQLVSAAVGRADIVLVSDVGKGVICPLVIETVLDVARKRGIMVLVDPSREQDYAIYRGATLLTPNRTEAGLATGVAVEGTEDFEPAARLLISKVNLDAVIITLDKHGLYLARRRGPSRLIPTFPRAVFDVTGAGDMILSTLGLALASHLDLETSAELANLAAGIEIEKLGATPVTINEMRQACAEAPHLVNAKIVSQDELDQRLVQHRQRGEKIVFTNGCFDLLHVGHVDYLSFSRRQGDVLVVGLNSDESVRALKGPDRPVQTQTERARIIAALADVRYVTIFDELTPERIIKRVRPDVLIKGEDWRDRGVVGREFVESYGGSVVLCPLVQGASSSSLVDRIRETAGVREAHDASLKGDNP